MRPIFLVIIICLLFSCQDKSKYALDDKSEMAELMLTMHAELDSVRTRIKTGHNIGSYPSEFDQILTASMTDESMRDEENFALYAQDLIDAEKELYTSSKDQQIHHYKNVINSCLACHVSVGCKGPIPKIKKLSWRH